MVSTDEKTAPAETGSAADIGVNRGCLFCKGGREEKVVLALTLHFPMLHVISPVKQRYRRVGGKAIEERVTLLPGYVFFETREPEIPLRDIVRQPNVLKVLKYPDGGWRLKGYDDQFARMMFRENGEIGFSKAVFDKGDRIHILDGFLKDLEGSIVRVNRRARTVEVRVDFQGKIISMWLGYELVEKT